jgi:hypothetical protein
MKEVGLKTVGEVGHMKIEAEVLLLKKEVWALRHRMEKAPSPSHLRGQRIHPLI